MRVRMLFSKPGATDEVGNRVMTYVEGEVYSPPPEVASTFLREGWAIVEPEAVEPQEAPKAAPTETKPARTTRKK